MLIRFFFNSFLKNFDSALFSNFLCSLDDSTAQTLFSKCMLIQFFKVFFFPPFRSISCIFQQKFLFFISSISFLFFLISFFFCIIIIVHVSKGYNAIVFLSVQAVLFLIFLWLNFFTQMKIIDYLTKFYYFLLYVDRL